MGATALNADTRNRIVMAAMELFWTKGFQSTSIADILSRTQIHSGSLYHFFPGKQHLLVAVLESLRDRIDEWLLQPAWSGIDDPRERIFALLNGYRTQLVSTDFAYGCPIGNIALELHEPDPEIRELLAYRNSSQIQHQSLAEARLPVGGATQEHYHVKTEEIYFITHGTGRMRIDNEEREVRAGDAIAIAPGRKHKLWNTGSEPLRLLCCCAPAYEHSDTIITE